MRAKEQVNKSKRRIGFLSEDFPIPTYDEWRLEVDKLLKGAPFDKIMLTDTYEDIRLKPLYLKNDVDWMTVKDHFPGFPPYDRAIESYGSVMNGWEIAQRLPYGLPERFNRSLIKDLKLGQTAVYLTPDKISVSCLDSDYGKSGKVGQDGVALSTLEDIETALNGVDFKSTPIFIEAYSSGMMMGVFLASLLHKKGVSTKILTGAIQTDPLGELAKNGILPVSMKMSYDEMARLTAWAIKNAPHLQTIGIHTSPYRHGGCSAVQELAFAVGTAVEYIRQMLEKNFTIDEIAPRIRFNFVQGSNFFMEIAKLRAARIVWNRIIQVLDGNDLSGKMHIHAETSSSNKTCHDPYVNILRNTTEAFAGIIGGIDSMHVGAFDELLREPDDFSRRIARNTQIILMEESHLDRIIDPAGGSYFIENLTKEMAEKSWKLFQEIEQLGGMQSALEKGFPQDQVKEIADRRLQNIAVRKDKIIGTNVYPDLNEKNMEHKISDAQIIYDERVEYLNRYRTTGDVEKHILPLEKLVEIQKASSEKVMDAAIDAVLASATIGEIRSALREGDDQLPEIIPVEPFRGAEMFEQLRKNMENYKKITGKVPKVFLANMGALSSYKAGSDFAAGFFETGGFRIMNRQGYQTSGEAAEMALESGAGVIVICSSDEKYPEFVPPLTKKIKTAAPGKIVVLAGYPKDQIDQYEQAGVDVFIHVRSNVYEILLDLQKKLGVIE
ncbi:MAG: methylmalonyl-CoA mutase family protein [Calditrichaceae bacterium]